MNTVKTIQWVIIGMFLGALLILWFSLNKANKENSRLLRELSNCVNAPHTIDTVHDTIMIIDDSVFKPTPIIVKNDTQRIQGPDSTQNTNKESICEEWYSQVYRGKGVRLLWKAHIKDCKIEEMQFPQIYCPKEIIYDTKVVDTCKEKVPAYIPLNHWGVELGLSAKSIYELPMTDINLWYTHKDKWGISGGILGNISDKELYGRVGVKLFIK